MGLGPHQHNTQTGQNENAFDKLALGSEVLFSIIDCLAQIILLYRCWIIWDSRWVVVAVPGFLVFVALVGEFALVGLQNTTVDLVHIFIPIGNATNSVSLVVNALTTALIVTKIFLTAREVRPVLGSNSHRSFRIVTALLIESGLLMFAFQLVFVVLFFRVPFNIISGATTQIYGITPTLLNIRVAMGTAYDKSTEKTRTLRFAHSEGPSMSAAGVRSRDINTELDDAANNERATDDAV
ncbi:hypothetical protein BD779DRAFT_1011319 [Infundibulicybe gibba]|nr:hypothetical protein BD779DRAFT_1011319 [Infundibulicybe gibba]